MLTLLLRCARVRAKHCRERREFSSTIERAQINSQTQSISPGDRLVGDAPSNSDGLQPSSC